PDDAELTRIAFAHAGIDRQLVVVRDGAEALDYLFARGQYASRDTGELPASVLLDLNLPKLDGREVLQALRGDARTRSLPVEGLSTSADPSDVGAACAVAVNSCILKPAGIEGSVHVVEEYRLYLRVLDTASVAR